MANGKVKCSMRNRNPRQSYLFMINCSCDTERSVIIEEEYFVLLWETFQNFVEIRGNDWQWLAAFSFHFCTQKWKENNHCRKFSLFCGRAKCYMLRHICMWYPKLLATGISADVCMCVCACMCVCSSGFVGLFNLLLLWPGFLLLDYTGFEAFELPSQLVWMYILINGLIGTVLSEFLWLWWAEEQKNSCFAFLALVE